MRVRVVNRVGEWRRKQAQWDAASPLVRVLLHRKWLQSVVRLGAAQRYATSEEGDSSGCQH